MSTQDLPSRPGLVALLLCLCFSLSAQVRGISYTLGPTANYTWFNNESGLDDALMIGGRLGIGFGEFVELRGLYMQTLGQAVDLAGFDVDTDLLAGSDIDLKRYGAELKLNLSRGHLLPYLTLGAGVQEIERQQLAASDNIFASAGLGLTLSAGDRFTFSLEGKNTAYNYSAVRSLLNNEERQAQNLDANDFPTTRFGNWSLGASANFYLGGRRPGELSEVDRAYIETFDAGLSGLRLPIEVNLMRLVWDDALPYRDAWLGGANIGIDFGPFVGLRAFYLRAMDEDKVNFDFDALSLYGGDARFKLGRTGRALTPFLTLGGGYIRVGDDYVARPERAAESQGFATGGGGLIIALGDYVRLNGSARALLTTSTDIQDLNTTEQLATSWMYGAGLTVALGRRARNSAATADEQIIEREIEIVYTDDTTTYNAEAAARETAALRQRYQQRIRNLEQQLNAAYAADDTERAANLLQRKQEAEFVIAELDSRSEQSTEEDAEAGRAERSGIVRMTPEQFTDLVRALRAEDAPRPAVDPATLEAMMHAQERRYRELQGRLQQLEAQLRRLRAEMNGDDTAPIDPDAMLRRLQRREERRREMAPDSSRNDRRLQRFERELEIIRERIKDSERDSVPAPRGDNRQGLAPQGATDEAASARLASATPRQPAATARAFAHLRRLDP